MESQESKIFIDKERLTSYLKEVGETQVWLSGRLGTQPANLSKIVNGERALSKKYIKPLEEALGTEIENLIQTSLSKLLLPAYDMLTKWCQILRLDKPDVQKHDFNIIHSYVRKGNRIPPSEEIAGPHHYLISPPPRDEVDTVRRLKAYLDLILLGVSSTSRTLRRPEVNMYCADEIADKSKKDEDAIKKVLSDRRLKQNLFLIGCPKYNYVTELIMDERAKVNSNLWQFYEEKTAKLGNGNNRASSENPAKPDYYLMRGGDPSKTLKHREQGAEGGHPNFATRSVDYAYVSRFRNPINPEAYYFVFAGLKTAGQKALRHYFEDAELVQDFHHDDEEFEIIVRVPYIRHVRKGKALAGPEIMPNEISTLRRDLYDLSDEEERAIST